MLSGVHPICRRIFDTQKLVAEFPPRFTNSNKQVVHRIACPPDSTHSGQVVFSRWAKMSLPHAPDPDGARTKFESRQDFFAYEPSPEGSATVEWYLNFSHSDLFCAYGGRLFAQDEMQVAEHPALGSLREALLPSDIHPLTVENGQPTPALIKGVERRCRVATDRNAEQGRPNGLYGNNFAAASAEAIAKATQAIVPPTISNVLAMEAPTGGRGRYGLQDIEYILGTAFTGFAAARFESWQDTVQPAACGRSHRFLGVRCLRRQQGSDGLAATPRCPVGRFGRSCFPHGRRSWFSGIPSGQSDLAASRGVRRATTRRVERRSSDRIDGVFVGR